MAFKKLKVLGINFDLEIHTSNKYKNYLESYSDKDGNKKQKIVFELKNPVTDLINSEMSFYTSIFYDQVLAMIKKWRTEIPRASYNKFYLKEQKMPMRIVYKQPDISVVKTNKKCESCGSEMAIKTNSKNDAKFYACFKCKKTESIQYDKNKDKKGYLLYINPRLLCDKSIALIDCIIIQNLVCTYIVFGSTEYWMELLKIYPDYINVTKTKPLDKNIKAALEDALKQMLIIDKKNESKYLIALEDINE